MTTVAYSYLAIHMPQSSCQIHMYTLCTLTTHAYTSQFGEKYCTVRLGETEILPEDFSQLLQIFHAFNGKQTEERENFSEGSIPTAGTCYK